MHRTAALASSAISSRGADSSLFSAGLATIIPARQHDRFMAVWFAHGASYLVGLCGGALLCFWVWRARGRPSVISLYPWTRAAAIRAGVIATVAVYVIWIRFYAS